MPELPDADPSTTATTPRGAAPLFFLWVFGLGLPVGPGAPTYFTP